MKPTNYLQIQALEKPVNGKPNYVIVSQLTATRFSKLKKDSDTRNGICSDMAYVGIADYLREIDVPAVLSAYKTIKNPNDYQAIEV